MKKETKSQILAQMKQKYGDKIFEEPEWTEADEEKYQNSLKQFDEKNKKNENKRRYGLKDGVKISEKILSRATKEQGDRCCPECGTMSFSSYDDIYREKYNCCFECFVLYVEGREEKWLIKQREKANEQKDGE